MEETKYKVSIGFSKPKKWKIFAELIMIIGRTKYSHTFTTWKCKEIDRRKVFEAVGSGVRILSNIVFKKEAKIIELYYIEATQTQLIEMEQIAHDLTGTDYGYKAVLGLGISKLFDYVNGKLGINGKQSNIFSDGRKTNACIEASARLFCKLVNIDIPKDIESYDLLKYRDLIAKYATKESQEKVDKINANI